MAQNSLNKEIFHRISDDLSYTDSRTEISCLARPCDGITTREDISRLYESDPQRFQTDMIHVMYHMIDVIERMESKLSCAVDKHEAE